MYHSYLGLAALAVLQGQEPKEKVLKDFMPALCFSREACERLEALPWRRKITGWKGQGATEDGHVEEQKQKVAQSVNTSFSSSQGSESTEESKGSEASVFGNMVYGY